MSVSANAVPRAAPRLPLPLVLAYASGSIGTAAFIIVPQLLLLFFMTDVLAVPPAWAAAALFVPKLWEFLTDPIIGAASDRLETPWGRRRPMMLIGAILFTGTFWMMFSVPDFDDWPARFLWVAILFALCTTAYTVYSVPYIAMPAEMTDGYDERTRIVSFRMVFVSIGVLLAGTLAPGIVAATGGGREGYAMMGGTFAALCGGVMLVSVIGTRSAVFTTRSDRSLTAIEQVRLGLANRPFRVLWIAFVVQMVSIAISTAVLPYFAKYQLGGGEALVTAFFLVFTLGTLASMPAWVALAGRMGKRDAFALSTVLQAIGATFLFWTPGLSPAAFLVGAAVMGVGNAGVQMFPFAMLPDVIDEDRRRTGLNREGAFTGIWIAGEKLGLAIGAAVIGLALSIARFEEGAGSVVSQPDAALLTIRLGMSVGPAAILILSLTMLSRYTEPNDSPTVRTTAPLQGETR